MLAIDQETLQAAALDALMVAQMRPDCGLSTGTVEHALARLEGLVTNAQTYQIQVFSDGLTLDHKIALERVLLVHLNERFPHPQGASHFSVYFRRKEQPHHGPQGQGAQPKPLGSRPAPFGLKIDRRAIPGVRAMIVVASGKGGVGKSTVSANLAVALAGQGQRVGLLDADIYGPSAPLMLGLQGPMPVASGGRLVPLEGYGVKTVSFGFLSDAYNPVIWRGPMVSKALEQLCYSVDWGDLDYLIVDLPPGTGDVQLTLIERLPLHGAIIVTTPQDVALLDAHKALTMFQKLDVRVLGVVENMACFTCPKCGHEEPVFGDHGGEAFAVERKIPLLGRIPLNTAIRRRGDAGQPAAADMSASVGKPFRDLGLAVTSAFS